MIESNKILIVDDAPENILVLQKILSDYQLFAVTSGQDALTWLEAHEADLILLDMSMPEMDGLSVLDKLKEREVIRNIPVLFVTAESSSKTESAALRAGAVDFIVKPVNPDVLLSRVQTHLSLCRQRQELRDHSFNLEQLVEERTQQLLNAKEGAEAANRAKTLFLGNISHEFRTPLHQIRGVSELLKRQPLDERGQKMLEMLIGAAKRLETMVEEILQLVSLEAQTATVTLDAVNLQQAAEACLAALRSSALEKGLRLELTIDPTIQQPVVGDRKHFETILACYTSNAIRFSERGTIRVRLIHKEETAETCRIRLEVEDEGPGIAPEAMNRIFEYFEQVDNTPSRRFGGTGVGLALVRKLARLLGGDAGCESKVGEGSRFWAMLEFRHL